MRATERPLKTIRQPTLSIDRQRDKGQYDRLRAIVDFSCSLLFGCRGDALFYTKYNPAVWGVKGSLEDFLRKTKECRIVVQLQGLHGLHGISVKMGKMGSLGKIGKTVVDDRCRLQAILTLLWPIVAREPIKQGV